MTEAVEREVHIRVLENDLEIAQAYAKLLHRQLQDTSAAIAGLEAAINRMKREAL